MQTVARLALTPGMTLGEDVKTAKAGIILPARTILDSVAIEKLARYDVMCVSIMEPEDFATTHYEKIAASKAFKEFEVIYKNNFQAYKYMVDCFIESSAPISLDYLLKIYHETADSVKDSDLLLDMLYSMVPTEDNMTYAHCFNSALIAGAFSSWLKHDEELQKQLIIAGFLYDIGKLKLPSKLIWKPGKLTDFEFNWMKTHTKLGADMINSMNPDQYILDAINLHHERSDGTGYPNKLHGDSIPYVASFIGIVDSYEAMTSARTWRSSLCPFQVIANFERGGFYQYDMNSLNKILEHFACTQVGRVVRLSNNMEAVVKIINPMALSQPIVEDDYGVLTNLSVEKDLKIEAVL